MDHRWLGPGTGKIPALKIRLDRLRRVDQEARQQNSYIERKKVLQNLILNVTNTLSEPFLDPKTTIPLVKELDWVNITYVIV